MLTKLECQGKCGITLVGDAERLPPAGWTCPSCLDQQFAEWARSTGVESGRLNLPRRGEASAKPLAVDNPRPGVRESGSVEARKAR